MARAKITVTLDKNDVRSIRDLVAARKEVSVSAFVQHAVSMALLDVAGWGAMLAEALDEIGGQLTARERVWADRVLGEATAPRKRRPGVA